MSDSDSDSDAPHRGTLSGRKGHGDSDLQDAYDELAQENAALHAQVEQVAVIRSRMEQMESQSKRSSSQLAAITSERDELADRLTISQQTITELSDHLADEKRSNYSRQSAAISTLKAELDKAKKQSVSQIESLSAKLLEAEQLLTEETTRNKVLSESIRRVCEAGKRYFLQEFNSAEDLVAALNKPKERPRAPPRPAPKPDNRLKRLTRLKTKLQSENEGLQAQVTDLQGELEELKAATSQRHYEYEQQIGTLLNSQDLADSQHRSIAASYTATIEALKSELASTKAVIPRAVVQQPLDLPKPIPIPPRGKSDVDLVGRITALSSDLRTSQTKRAELTEQLQQSEKTVRQLELGLEKEKSEHSALNVLYQEALAQVRTLRSVIPPPATEPLTKPIQRVAAKLQRKVDDQAQKICALEATLARQKAEIQERGSQVRELELDKRNLEEELQSAKANLREAQVRIETTRVPTGDHVVSSDAFQLGEAEPGLASVLLKIASNNALAPISKIQAAIKAVQSHYLNKIASRDEALDQAFSENQRLAALFNQFLIDVSIVLTGSPVKLDDVLSSDAAKKLVSDAAELRRSLSTLTYQCETQSQALTSLATLFKGYYPEGSDAMSQVKEIKAAWDSNVRQLSAMSHKLRIYQRSQESPKTAAAQTIAELNSTVATLQAELSQAEQTINQLTRQQRASKQEQQWLTERLEQAQIANEDQQLAMRKEHQDELEKLAQANHDMQARIRGDIAEWQSNTQKLVAQHKEDGQHIATLTRRVHTLLNAKRQQEDEHKQLISTIAEKEELTAVQQRQEKAAIAKTHEASIADLRQQLGQARKDAEQLAQSRNDADQQAREAAVENAKLEKERRRAAAEAQNLRAELEREKQVAAAAIDTAKMTAESNFYQKLEDQRAKGAAEKRQILVFGIDTFRGFFAPSEPVGEVAFRKVLEKAKSDLTRLTKSDAAIRGIVGARERQPTEDAVAQLLLRAETL